MTHHDSLRHHDISIVNDDCLASHSCLPSNGRIDDLWKNGLASLEHANLRVADPVNEGNQVDHVLAAHQRDVRGVGLGLRKGGIQRAPGAVDEALRPGVI